MFWLFHPKYVIGVCSGIYTSLVCKINMFWSIRPNYVMLVCFDLYPVPGAWLVYNEDGNNDVFIIQHYDNKISPWSITTYCDHHSIIHFFTISNYNKGKEAGRTETRIKKPNKYLFPFIPLFLKNCFNSFFWNIRLNF